MGLIWWSVLSVATALVPPSMAGSLWVLIAVRFVLGMGESVAYPSSNQFIAAWFPTQERGKANGWVFGGVGLGSGTAPPLVAFIIYNLWLARGVLCLRRHRPGDRRASGTGSRATRPPSIPR